MTRGRSEFTTWRRAWVWPVAVGLTAGGAWAQTSGGITRAGSATPITNSETSTTMVSGTVSGGAPCETDAECLDDNACTTDSCAFNQCMNSPIQGCIPCRNRFDCPTLEVVFVLDTSGSMRDEAGSLCATINDLVATIGALGGDVHPTILGITETPATSFPCITGNVADLLGIDVPGDEESCPLAGNPSAFESWGPGTAIVAERFPWMAGAFRMVVPMSDEGPCGGDFPDGCNDPGDDRDSIENAIDVALRNRVIVSPLMGSGSGPCAIHLGTDLAEATGGTLVLTKAVKSNLRAAFEAMLLDVCEKNNRCDDEDFCTCDDTCVEGRCEGRPIPECKPCNATGVCSDANVCTSDVCIDMACVSTPNHDPARFYCDPETGVLTPLEELDDGNPCTRLVFDPCTGRPSHVPVLDFTPCEDGLFCTEGDVCLAGECGGRIDVDCTDLNGPCVAGICDEEQDTCVAAATHENEPCDDGEACRVGETCQNGVCVIGTPVVCPPTGNVCTIRDCDRGGEEGNCDLLGNANENGPCSDGNECTVEDVCVSGVCVGGPERVCVDKSDCTNDSCQPLTGCVFTPRTGACNDGDFCTVEDACQGGVCVGGPERHCDDDNVCTTDQCDSEKGCVYTPNSFVCNDGNACTTGDQCEQRECVGHGTLFCPDDDVCQDVFCDPQTGCVHEFNTDPCQDDDFCTIDDTCDGQGVCRGTDIRSIPCADSDDCLGAPCDTQTGLCVCSERPSLCLTALPGSLGPEGCYNAGDVIVVNVDLGFSSSVVTGGQFLIPYDPAVLDFLDAQPGALVDPTSPFSLVVNGEIDEVTGRIFYAVGVLFDGTGTNGPAVMASFRFRALQACTSTELCFASENPKNTLLTDESGHSVPFEPCCAAITIEGDPVALFCPVGAAVNADAGFVTAEVLWAESASASGGCSGSPTLTCTGRHSEGVNISGLIPHGGRFPRGLSQFECSVTDTCGSAATCSWSVHVSSANAVEVNIQLSPVVVDRSLFRCIVFELFSSCPEPVIVEETVEFGGPFNLPGHADFVTLKVPAGRYECVAIRDPLHTLRSVSDMTIVDKIFQATFKGDPFFGGNWLRSGNLNGDRKIDVIDFGIFVAEFLNVVSVHTPCGTQGINADLNGDGIVDSLDYTILDRHFLQADKLSCCGTGATAAADDLTPRNEISIAELEQLGFAGLGTADLNGDGLLNDEDRWAFSAGFRPALRKTSRSFGSSLRDRR